MLFRFVASFLVKDLHIDWRWGERYFAEQLNDFDLSANNGGWQWASSTGCDAQPYFRIFNPVTQSEKFDPKGEFIRKYDLSNFKMLFLAGERCDPPTLEWAQEMLKVPVIDHWWQTETGWSIVANSMGLLGDDGKPFPVKAGSPTKAAMGWDVRALAPDGKIGRAHV